MPSNYYSTRIPLDDKGSVMGLVVLDTMQLAAMESARAFIDGNLKHKDFNVKMKDIYTNKPIQKAWIESTLKELSEDPSVKWIIMAGH